MKTILDVKEINNTIILATTKNAIHGTSYAVGLANSMREPVLFISTLDDDEFLDEVTSLSECSNYPIPSFNKFSEATRIMVLKDLLSFGTYKSVIIDCLYTISDDFYAQLDYLATRFKLENIVIITR